jgi:hypothetical protein
MNSAGSTGYGFAVCELNDGLVRKSWAKWMEYLTMSRTLEDFVEDMVSNGRKPVEVRAVALATRWRPFIEEAEEMTREFFSKQKKKIKAQGQGV